MKKKLQRYSCHHAKNGHALFMPPIDDLDTVRLAVTSSPFPFD